MSLEELFSGGFLKKIPASKERTLKSIATAEKYLDQAKKSFDVNADYAALLAAYAAAFHAARAVLFTDGVGERAHFAVYEYLKEKHRQLGADEIEAFDAYRRLRHAAAYGIESVITEKDSLATINFAAKFIRRVKEYLGL